jgi:hypothetical protein
MTEKKTAKDPDFVNDLIMSDEENFNFKNLLYYYLILLIILVQIDTILQKLILQK